MSKPLRNIFCSVFFFIGFIWLHTFIRLNSYISDSNLSSYILKAAIAIIATVFYYWCFIGIIDSLESLCKISIGKCAVALNLICLVMIAALIIELSTDNFSIIGEQEIRIISLTISKKYIFDICIAVFFPVIVEYILKSMVNENFSHKSIVCGTTAILLVSLVEYLLFFAMRNIWLVDMAVINLITLTVGVMKYVIPQKKVRKGNIIGILILYALIYIFLFFLLSYGSGLSEFLYGATWDEYREGAWFIIKNASLFGTSEQLLSSVYIHDWLINRNNYILQLLFYGGWAAVVGLITFMIAFLYMLIHLLGLKNLRIHRHQLVYTTAFSVLAVRTVMGILYSFALLPYPVVLPFGGTYSIITDSIVFGLILYGAWENYRYEQVITYEPVEPESFLAKEMNYQTFTKENEKYEEEGFGDQVCVQDSAQRILCDVEWTYGNERQIAVFIPADNPNHQVFLLEHTTENLWRPVDDRSLYPSVMEEFFYYRTPDCMKEDDTDET